MDITKFEENLNDLLYNEKEGLLMKYHFNQGLDYDKLEQLYDYLETFRSAYKLQHEVPKSIVFILIGIIPALYLDITLYTGDTKIHQQYLESIYKLDTVLMMCFNPDLDDPFFDTPLKDLS